MALFLGWLAQLVEHLVYTDLVCGLFPLQILLNSLYTSVSTLSRHTSSQKRKDESMSTIRKHYGKWQAIIRANGHPSINKSFVSKTDASRFASNTEVKLRRDDAGISNFKFPKFEDVARRYIEEISITKKTYQDEKCTILNLIKESWATYPINRILGHHVNKYKLQQLKTVSGSSINRRLDVVSSMFTTFKKEWGLSCEQSCLNNQTSAKS